MLALISTASETLRRDRPKAATAAGDAQRPCQTSPRPTVHPVVVEMLHYSLRNESFLLHDVETAFSLIAAEKIAFGVAYFSQPFTASRHANLSGSDYASHLYLTTEFSLGSQSIV